MTYKDPDKQKEAQAKASRAYRDRQNINLAQIREEIETLKMGKPPELPANELVKLSNRIDDVNSQIEKIDQHLELLISALEERTQFKMPKKR